MYVYSYEMNPFGLMFLWFGGARVPAVPDGESQRTTSSSTTKFSRVTFEIQRVVRRQLSRLRVGQTDVASSSTLDSHEIQVRVSFAKHHWLRRRWCQLAAVPGVRMRLWSGSTLAYTCKSVCQLSLACRRVACSTNIAIGIEQYSSTTLDNGCRPIPSSTLHYLCLSQVGYVRKAKTSFRP